MKKKILILILVGIIIVLIGITVYFISIEIPKLPLSKTPQIQIEKEIPAEKVSESEPTKQDCGSIIDTHIFAEIGERTAQEINNLKCFSDAIIECKSAISAVLNVSGEDEGGFEILGKENESCIIKSHTVEGAKTCYIPISLIEDLKAYAEQNQEPIENIIGPLSLLMAFESGTNIETGQPIEINCTTSQ